uniref:FHA domain-containing protein n=1 Tax=Panagrolaimus sp. JU765 TaxID=591449 RepID=A0AC34QEY6_9BILA
MLRRYSSLGLQNYVLTSPTTLIGSSTLSDIVVKGPDVAERHALIEYHPVIRSYWLRDLGTLGGTFCNGQTLYGMVELKPADVLKFGKSAEFIFDLPTIQPSPERRTSVKIGHSHCVENGSHEKDNIVLPIVGNRIMPKPGNERFSRPSLVNKKLCQKAAIGDNGSETTSTGPMHLNEYRVALAEAEAENAKLRAVLAQDSGKSSDKLFEIFQERIKQAENDAKLSELVYKTFFAVVVDELEAVNKTCVKLTQNSRQP